MEENGVIWAPRGLTGRTARYPSKDKTNPLSVLRRTLFCIEKLFGSYCE
jgi:hypothetical protein